MNFPKVIVLVLSYNGKYLLEDALNSYLKNDYANYQIMVIDNGSDDGTVDYVNENFKNILVRRIEKNQGYSGGFNFGLNIAFNEMNADYALITNNDVVADKDIISELVKVAVTDDKIGFTTGKVYFNEKKDTLQTVGMSYDPVRLNGGHIGNAEIDKGQYDKVTERYFADDVFTMVNKNLYKEIGGYDPEFVLQAEQFDWQMRAKEKGYKIMFTPHAKLWHKESMTIGKHSPAKLYFDARNPMIVLMKYVDAKAFKKYLWLHFKKDTLRASLVNLKHFYFRIALNIWLGFFSGIMWGIKNKKLTMKHIF
ncbi:MAG: glycosyltransferase family 2 protein [Ignavibacteriae bacterium]|nr:glycosyltransferase family 2 protein [Ignavibacteriota bacterium]